VRLKKWIFDLLDSRHSFSCHNTPNLQPSFFIFGHHSRVRFCWPSSPLSPSESEHSTFHNHGPSIKSVFTLVRLTLTTTTMMTCGMQISVHCNNSDSDIIVKNNTTGHGQYYRCQSTLTTHQSQREQDAP
jgi:hypothetical protein